MRILLDSSHLCELKVAPGKLTKVERRFFGRRDARSYVSSASVWEMRPKYHSRRPTGTRKGPFDPNGVVDVLASQDLTLLPMTILHAAWELETPPDRKDPFDERLLA